MKYELNAIVLAFVRLSNGWKGGSCAGKKCGLKIAHTVSDIATF